MKQNQNSEYNNIPVYYCRRCFSLRIMTDEQLGDYCPDCGCTEIIKDHIEDWKSKYIAKFKKLPFKE